MSNALLDALPRRVARRLVAQTSEVDLPAGQILIESGSREARAYFPLSALIAITCEAEPGESLAVALVGNDGMLGVTLLVGGDIAPLRSLVVSAGAALCMPAEQFRQELRDSSSLSKMVNHYAGGLLREVAQSAVCGRFHRIDGRLASFLLRVWRRSSAPRLPMTHALLAELLGVRRSAVSIAAAGFQRDELIRYTRGEITILSERGLELAACGCTVVVTRDDAC